MRVPSKRAVNAVFKGEQWQWPVCLYVCLFAERMVACGTYCFWAGYPFGLQVLSGRRTCSVRLGNSAFGGSGQWCIANGTGMAYPG